MPEPMTDERLAQLSVAAHSPFPFDHPATQIVADAVAELVVEVKRLRAQLAELPVVWAVEDKASPTYGRLIVSPAFDTAAEARDWIRTKYRSRYTPMLKWRRNWGPWHEESEWREVGGGNA